MVATSAMQAVEQRLGVKRDDILRVAAKHGAVNVRVFGSLKRFSIAKWLSSRRTHCIELSVTGSCGKQFQYEVA
jgi:hypothetical protein